jgi:aminoglycoside 3-N-acetyltransferase
LIFGISNGLILSENEPDFTLRKIFMDLRALTEGWRASGVEPGDVVLLHGNIVRTIIQAQRAGAKLTPEDILQSFLDALGPAGTLLLPLFNFDFARGVPFDIRTTPSKMGVLTETGRAHPQAGRTGHPIYSFAVIGAKSQQFAGVDNYSAYGKDSPFGMLREMNGKIAVLNLPDHESMTFYHHVEEMNAVPYRYHKEFSGAYTDAAGTTSERKDGMFVRDLERGVVTLVDPVGELLWARGIYRGQRPKEGTGLRVAAAREVYAAVTELIQSGQAEGMLYKIERPEK